MAALPKGLRSYLWMESQLSLIVWGRLFLKDLLLLELGQRKRS